MPESSLVEELSRLRDIIKAHHDWWFFPEEGAVKGFMGIGPIMFVGDQPSRSEWGQNHPNRRVFYDTLLRIGAADAHITDLYKRRGPAGELANAQKLGTSPSDLADHLDFFRIELELIQPTRVIAIGRHAYDLITKFAPEVQPKLHALWHFAYVAYCAEGQRLSRYAEYERRMREACGLSAQ